MALPALLRGIVVANREPLHVSELVLVREAADGQRPATRFPRRARRPSATPARSPALPSHQVPARETTGSCAASHIIGLAPRAGRAVATCGRPPTRCADGERTRASGPACLRTAHPRPTGNPGGWR